MNEASKLKGASVLVRHLIPQATRKTRAAAPGGYRKRHPCKLLAIQFHRHGFTFRQIAREGNAAVYEQVWIGCAKPTPAYEVIVIRCRDGFQIDGRFVEPAEVYPNSEAWGMDGFTFINRDKAWAKFFEISLEEPARRGREVK